MNKNGWSSSDEIIACFSDSSASTSKAGVNVYEHSGRIYTYTGESPILVTGRTGAAKSQCCTIPFVENIYKKDESVIYIDPKGEIYASTHKLPEHYQSFVLDYRAPRFSPNGFDPLKLPYRLFQKGDRDGAYELLSYMCRSLFPKSPDPFWQQAASNLCFALAAALIECSESEDEVNLGSLNDMLMNAEAKAPSGFMSLSKQLYNALPSGSIAKKFISTYVCAPNETRASIQSVASNGLAECCISEGFLSFSSVTDDRLMRIDELDVSRPFSIAVILPDENDTYAKAAGTLISELSLWLIRQAQKNPAGRLPIRTNIVIEELGLIGRSIPTLHFLCSGSRSRNIRLLMCCQSTRQLTEIYGENIASSIISSVGVNISFATNDFPSLKELSLQCGKHWDESDTHKGFVPVITEQELFGMPPGTACIRTGELQFISKLPMYYKMHPKELELLPRCTEELCAHTSFDFGKFVNRVSGSREPVFAANPFGDLGELVRRNPTERSDTTDRPTEYRVKLLSCSGSYSKIVRIITTHTDMSISKANASLMSLPAVFEFPSAGKALAFANDLRNAGADLIFDN